MNRIDTLFRSLLVAAPLAFAACTGSVDAEALPAGEATTQTGEPTAAGDSAAASEENKPGDPVVVNADGVPMSELENDTRVEGTEGGDRGYADALTTPPPQAPTSDDDVAQGAQALLSTRGGAIKNEALRIAGFVNASTSYYSHTTYMNESTGTRQTDCSGLTGYMLSRAVPDAVAKVSKPTWRAKPLAEDYFDYIASRPTTASQQTTTRWRRMLSVRISSRATWSSGSTHRRTRTPATS